MSSQELLVALSNTIHLVATVLWIGWSGALALWIAPRALDAHADEQGIAGRALRRSAPVAYGALAALGATGMLQMSAHPSYEGLLTIGNTWSVLMAAKHLLILASVALILWLAQGVGPRLRLAARRAALGHDAAPAHALAARFRAIAWLNAALGLAILALTGAMTAMH